MKEYRIYRYVLLIVIIMILIMLFLMSYFKKGTYSYVDACYNNGYLSECPSGYPCNSIKVGTTTCYQCPSGYKLSSSGATCYIYCQSNSYIANIGDSFCTLCPNGGDRGISSYVYYGHVTNMNNYPCTSGIEPVPLASVTEGYYCPSSARFECPRDAGNICCYESDFVECEVGNYCTRGMKHQCSGNTYTNSKGTTGSGCPNKCSDDGSVVNSNHTGCESCTAGAIANSEHTQCITCSDGKYANDSHSECLTCGAGYYCKNGIGNECTNYQYSTANSSECLSCGSGYIGNREKGATYCVPINQPSTDDDSSEDNDSANDGNDSVNGDNDSANGDNNTVNGAEDDNDLQFEGNSTANNSQELFITNSTFKSDDVSSTFSNPSTGTLLVVMAWIIGLLAIIYSLWYFKKISSV